MASVEQYTLPVIVAGTALTTDIGEVEAHGGEGFAVGEINLVTRTAQVAQGGTAFCTLGLQYVRAVAGVAQAPVVLATLNLGTTALVQDIPVPFVYTVAQERAVLQAGDVLQVTATHTGAGGGLAAGALLEVERD